MIDGRPSYGSNDASRFVFPVPSPLISLAKKAVARVLHFYGDSAGSEEALSPALGIATAGNMEVAVLGRRRQRVRRLQP